MGEGKEGTSDAACHPHVGRGPFGRLKKKNPSLQQKSLEKTDSFLKFSSNQKQTSSPTKSPKFLQDCLKNHPFQAIYTLKTNITPENMYLPGNGGSYWKPAFLGSRKIFWQNTQLVVF